MNDVESVIIAKLIDTILAAGYLIDVRDAYGDGDEPVEPTSNRCLIDAEIGATGETVLDLYDSEGCRGFILLIHGNGEDVISDSSDNETIRGILGDD